MPTSVEKYPGPPALLIPLEAAQADPALESRGGRKILVTALREATERQTTDPIWAPAHPCPVVVTPDLEVGVFNERSAQQNHFHARGTEIYILVEGKLTVEVEGADYAMSAGDMLVVFPGARHLVKSQQPFLCRFVTVNCGGAADKFTD